MNENIDLTRILKNCPKGTKFYSTIFGEVEFLGFCNDEEYAVTIKRNYSIANITKDGRYVSCFNGECTLFPSKEQRDWSKFTAPWHKKERFDPKTLKVFDKVLARVSDNDNCLWFADFVSTPASNNMLTTVIGEFGCDMVIPYNDDTKHLVGTTDEAPEYYRYWEE